MTPTTIKLLKVYLPFLAVLAGLMTGYTLLYWWLVIDQQIIPLGTILATWIVPLLLAIACTYLFLYKPVHLLALKPGKGNPYTSYLVGVLLLLAAPVIATQYLLIDAAGKRVALDTPEALANHPYARYFTIKQYQPDLGGSHAKVFSQLTGKRNKNMTHDLVVALPLYTPGKLPPGGQFQPISILLGANSKAQLPRNAGYQVWAEAPAWICFQYGTKIPQTRTDAEKTDMLQVLAANANADFPEAAHRPFTYLRRPLNSSTIDKFTATVRESTGSFELDHLVLEPVFEPFDERYQLSLLLSVGCLLGSLVIMLSMVLSPALDYPKWEKRQREKAGNL